jgi:hypothetical protein
LDHAHGGWVKISRVFAKKVPLFLEKKASLFFMRTVVLSFLKKRAFASGERRYCRGGRHFLVQESISQKFSSHPVGNVTANPQPPGPRTAQSYGEPRALRRRKHRNPEKKRKKNKKKKKKFKVREHTKKKKSGYKQENGTGRDPGAESSKNGLAIGLHGHWSFDFDCF